MERYGEWLYNTSSSSSCEAEPITLSEALQRQDGKLWREATENEYNSLLENDVWNLTNLPEGRKAIGCIWVLKRKMNPDGTVQKIQG